MNQFLDFKNNKLTKQFSILIHTRWRYLIVTWLLALTLADIWHLLQPLDLKNYSIPYISGFYFGHIVKALTHLFFAYFVLTAQSNSRILK